MGCLDVEASNRVGPDSEAGSKPDEEDVSPFQEDRKCKDVLFLIIYLGFLAGLVYVGIVAIEKGDWRRLLYGTDSNGNLCGVGKMKDYKKIVYLDDIEFSLGVGFSNARRVCASECPKAGRVCTVGDFPCSLNSQYVCPYYKYVDFNATIAGLDEYSSSYYDKLAESNATAAGSASCKEMQSLVSEWDQSGWLGELPSFLAQSLRDSANAGLCGVLYQSMSAVPGRGPCFPALLETLDVINRCIPTASGDISGRMPRAFVNVSTISELQSSLQLSTLEDLWNDEQLRYYMSDVVRSWPIVLVCGVVGGTLFSIGWMFCLRYGASVVTFITVLVVNLGLVAATLYCYLKAEIIEGDDVEVSIKDYLPDGFKSTSDDDFAWHVLAYVFSGITFVVLVVTLLVIPRLKIAVSLVKVASQAIAAMPSLIAFPIVPLFALIFFLAWWVAIVAFLWSAGDEVERRGALSQMTNSTTYAKTCEEDPFCTYDIEWDDTMTFLFIYHLFGLFWASQFIVGFGYVAIAGAVARYYWCKGEVEMIPRNPVKQSAGAALRYHLGSIAFGSFFVASVQFLRGALQYVVNRVKAVLGEGKSYLFCCLRCGLWLIEKVLRFTNRNAYILVAVKGTSYCTSVMRSWRLVMKNAVQVAAVSVIADVLIWLGKLSIAIACGVAALAMSNISPYTDPSSDSYLSSQVMPVALSVIVGYIISAIFYQAYEIAIDTMLLSYCEDCERSGGKAEFAPALLAKALRQ